MHTTHKKKGDRSGLSLIEVVMATLLVGVMLVASLDTLGGVYQTQRRNATRLSGPGLAHDLLSEVMAMPYADPDELPDTVGSTRAAFDDIKDYDNWDSPNAVDKEGTALPGYTGWRREVDIQWCNRDTGEEWVLWETGIYRVLVTVTAPDGKQTQLLGLRSRDGALEQTPAVNMTVVTRIGAALQLGNSPIVARQGTPLTNHATDTN